MPGKRRQKDDEISINSDGRGPVKNVPSLMGEGEKFFRDQLYSKAIQCYSEVINKINIYLKSGSFYTNNIKALELSPGNKAALVERAACYLKTGKNELALADAEESLKENKEFTKVCYLILER